MSSSTLTFVAKQVAIYLDIPVLVCGILGGLLNTIVFLSLKTFRQSSCSFYLTIMSITNIGQLITGLLSRIMINGFAIDWTQTSLFYCKFRSYCFQICGLISMTCYCLATIDQFFATCSRPQWRQWCSIKLARRLCIISAIIWTLYAMPTLFFYNLIVSSTTGKLSCTLINFTFSKYVSYANSLVLLSSLPVCITVLFGFLAYRNVQQIAHRTLPLVRREFDKQLTTMVLFQVIINFFCLLPYSIVLIIPTSDSVIAYNTNYTTNFTIILYYLYYANPFFIYVCTSQRFRRQLIYVLFEVYFHRWQQQTMVINQVGPQI